MADIWITVNLTDRSNDADLGTKAFLVNFSSEDPQVWFSNAVNWAEDILRPTADMLVLETQEAVLAKRRIDLEKALIEQSVEFEAVIAP